MRTVLFALALLILPSALSAATITYSHSFHEENEVTYPGFPFEGPFVEAVQLPIIQVGWLVPAFDPALGVVEALFLDLDATLVVTTETTPETPVLLGVHFPDPITHSPMGESIGSSSFAYLPGDPQFDWFIGLHSDSIAMYDIRSTATIHVLLTGTAFATYLYTPAVTAVPEPTSLLLIGSGLLAIRYRKYLDQSRKGRNRCHRRRADTTKSPRGW